MQEKDYKNPKDTLEKLAERLEKELGAKRYFTQYDLRGDEIKQERSPEILELEKEIEDLNQDFFPNRILETDRELEGGDDLELEFKKELDQNKDIERRKKNQEKAIKKFIKSKQKEIHRETHFAADNSAEQRSASFTSAPEKKQKVKLGFGWYFKKVKKPVIYLAGVEILIYILGSISFIKPFLQNIVLPLIVILDIIVILWLTVRIVKKDNQNYTRAIKAGLLLAFFVGLIRAFFKLFWINSIWTVFNLVVEPLILMIYALIIILISSLFIIKKRNA